MKMFYEQDVKMDALKGKKVAILGYGSQGHAHAQNLRDSGVDVVVGLHDTSKSIEKAKNDGFEVVSVADATKMSDIVMCLMPDTAQKKIYDESIKENLREGQTLAFAHGFNIHYNLINPPEFVDVIMVAPKGPGHLLRSVYKEGSGVPCLFAVYKDATGYARDTVLAYAKGIGGTRAGVLETTFKEETETDLFGEQAVLCGGCEELIKAGFETLVNAGYQPEIAYFECLHEMKLIVDLIYQGGMAAMRYSISDTAEYGDYMIGNRIVTDETKKEMKKVLTEIQDGTFARNWLMENQVGRPQFNAMRRMEAEHPIEKVGKELREMMSWIDTKNLD